MIIFLEIKKSDNININKNKNYDTINQKNDIIRYYNQENDTILNYDYRKLYDPLEQPSRRIPRHEIYPYYMKKLIDYPTRGYPDNFTQLGILVKKDDNKILKLYGRQIFPGSNQYEYYTSINNEFDQIKIPIKVNRQEIYDDDDIYIKVLNEHYKVHLYKYDAPKYYPIIY